MKCGSSDSTRIYRYSKSSFPIETTEGGQTATLVASGTLDNSELYRQGTFGFCTYSGGQLNYAVDNFADLDKGFFLSTLVSGTCSGTNPRRTSWLQGNVQKVGWNINDFDSLYGLTISGTDAEKIRLFNMTPTTTAFCNVVSSNRALDAGTSENSTITAQVMNTYGQPLEDKTVSFTVSVGDGTLSPASSVTNSDGEATTTYTVGTAITTSTVVATVNI